MNICQTCAIEYDPRLTTSPRRYCSQACYNFGERPYNKVIVQRTEIEVFAAKLVDKLHYLSHNNNNRFDCKWDLCKEAKLLGI